MANDVSIVFKASDNLSNSLANMRKNVDRLSKDVSEYRKVQSQAFDKKTEVKLDITKAKKELKDLERAVKDNVEGSEKSFKEKQKSLELLQEEYRRLAQVAKEASKAERTLQEDINKSSNRNASRDSGIGSTGVSGLGNVAIAGLGNMIGQTLVANISQGITSTYGESAGATINNIFGGAISGAAIGALAGPVGAALGSIVGSFAGVINDLTEKQQKRDDTFKDEVKSLYDTVKAEQEQTLTSGITKSSNREQDMISFGTLLGGDDKATQFLSDVTKFGMETPFEGEDLLKTSKTLLGYGYIQDEILPLMRKVGDTGSALGMKVEDMNWIATSLGRMKMSDKATLEYINPLQERAIPVARYLSEALGKSEKQISEMISKGSISGREAAQIIADAMGKQFEGNMEKQSKTYGGLTSAMEDVQAELDRAMGEGYNETRKKGLDEEIKLLEGKTGDKLKEANKLIGQYKAELENEYQKSITDAMQSAMEGTDFIKAKEEGNGAEMGKIVAEARAKAEIAYKNSEGYKLQHETDLSLVTSLQTDVAINNSYLDYGRMMGEQFSKGYAGVIEELKKSTTADINQINKMIDENGTLIQKADKYFAEDYDKTKDAYHTGYNKAWDPKLRNPNFLNSHATGLDRVPYDGYLAKLHEGEKVLTKVEAEQKNANQAPNVTINLNNYANNTEEIARQIVLEINRASENYIGR